MSVDRPICGCLVGPIQFSKHDQSCSATKTRYFGRFELSMTSSNSTTTHTLRCDVNKRFCSTRNTYNFLWHCSNVSNMYFTIKIIMDVCRVRHPIFQLASFQLVTEFSVQCNRILSLWCQPVKLRFRSELSNHLTVRWTAESSMVYVLDGTGSDLSFYVERYRVFDSTIDVIRYATEFNISAQDIKQ